MARRIGCPVFKIFYVANTNKLQNRIDQAYTDKLDRKIPEDLCLGKMNVWREEQSGFLNQIQAHQQANESFLIQGNKLLELANKAHSLYLQQSSREKARLFRIVQSTCTWDSLTPSPIYRKPFDLLVKGLLSENWLLGQDSNLRPFG